MVSGETEDLAAQLAALRADLANAPRFLPGVVTEITSETVAVVNVAGLRTVPCDVPLSLGGLGVGQRVTVREQQNSRTVDAILDGGGVVPVGAVIDFFGAALPAGYLRPDGSTFSAATYPGLYAVLGSTTLPDCREKVGVGYSAGSSFAGTLKATGGSANAVVVSHNHTYANQSNNTSPPRGTGADWTVAAIADVSHNTSTEGVSGTNKNLQPYYVCNKIIRAI